MSVNMLAQSTVSDARNTQGSTKIRREFAPSRLQAGTLDIRPYCPGCSAKSCLNRKLAVSPPTANMTPENATRQLLPVMLVPSFHPARTSDTGSQNAGAIAQNDAVRAAKKLGPDPMSTIDEAPSPEPRRDKDALYQTARPRPHGTGLRSAGRGVSTQRRRAQLKHRSGRARYSSPGVSLSRERKTTAISGFVQQRRPQIASMDQNSDP